MRDYIELNCFYRDLIQRNYNYFRENVFNATIVFIGKTSTGKGRGGPASSSDKGDRKSPLSSSGSTSATNSPKKPQSRDQSDNENEDSDNSSKVSSKSSAAGNTSEVPASNGASGGGLKVPPLKIVLSTSGTGNNPSGCTVDSASTNPNRDVGNTGNNTSSSVAVSSNPSNGAAPSNTSSASANPEPNKKGMFLQRKFIFLLYIYILR